LCSRLTSWARSRTSVRRRRVSSRNSRTVCMRTPGDEAGGGRRCGSSRDTPSQRLPLSTNVRSPLGAAAETTARSSGGQPGSLGCLLGSG
jgi:hypothetical protein